MITNDEHSLFAADVRTAVEARLHSFLEQKRVETLGLSPASIEMVDAVAALTLRGGKRLRPVVATAAMQAVDASLPPERAVDLGASLELLQTYLLAHDDLMDGDVERRGGPSLHASFRPRHGERIGDALGILGGDLASAYALELLLAAPFEGEALRAGVEAFVRLREEVYLGQHLDVVGDADVTRMHDLKTGSYTVRGPAMLGALLAGADRAQLAALRAWADPLGEAFQLADDLLGTFGDVRRTGKPGDDLRHGKRNAVTVEAERRLSDEERARLELLLGNEDAPDAELRALVELLSLRGVPDAIASRIDVLVQRSEEGLDRARLSSLGKRRLRGVGRLLTRRQS